MDKLLLYLKNNFIAVLFIAWWFTLPMGAFFGSVDLGAMVLYPNLVCALLLGIFGLKSIFKWEKTHYFFFGFLVLWTIQGGVQFFSQTKTALALFDLRSLLMQMITAFVLFSTFAQLGKERFFKIVVYGLRFSLLILIVSGFFESYTGIHIVGTFTEKILALRVGNIHYAPVFLYDNPNDFVAHYLFFTIFLMLLYKKWAKQTFLMLMILVTGYFFAFLADSLFGKITVVLLSIFYLLREFSSINFNQKLIGIGAITVFALLFLTNPIFIGPRYQNGNQYRINEMVNVKIDSANVEILDVKTHYSLADQKRIYNALDSLEHNNPTNSQNVRKALMLNSFHFIKEAPFWGIGVGQFYQRHIDKNVPNNTGTVTSAHCFPLEIIATYGLSGWIYFIFLGFVFIQLLCFSKQLELSYSLLVCCFMTLAIIWLMPSNYLYLEISKMTIPLLLLLTSIKKNELSEC